MQRSGKTRGVSGYLALASLEELRVCAFPFFFHAFEAELVGALPCDHDEIHAVRDEVRPEAKTLAAKPLHAAPHDGVADLLRRDHAEP